RSDPGAIVAMKVLVKQNVVAPVRIRLKLLSAAKHGAAAGLVAKKDAGQANTYFSAHLEERHQVPRPGWALDLEVVSVICVELEERANQHGVEGRPDRAPPVGIASEHGGVGLRRYVLHFILSALNANAIRMLLVVAGHGSNTIGAQEL